MNSKLGRCEQGRCDKRGAEFKLKTDTHEVRKTKTHTCHVMPQKSSRATRVQTLGSQILTDTSQNSHCNVIPHIKVVLTAARIFRSQNAPLAQQ